MPYKFNNLEKCDNARRYTWYILYRERYINRIHISILYTVITGLLVYNYLSD